MAEQRRLPEGRFRLAEFVVDPERNLLSGEGGLAHLEPRVMALLMALARRAGRVVERDVLIDEVWNGACGADQSLTNGIAHLRRAVGDSRARSRLIETVPKRGYRLLAEPVPVAEPARLQGARNAVRNWARDLAAAGLAVAALVLALSDPGGSWRASPTDASKAVAILPFEVLGGGSEDRYLAEGLAQELQTQLARAPHVTLAARGSARALIARKATVEEIGAALNVATVLQGAVRRSGDTIRINVQLSDAARGVDLWAEQYERPLGDLFALQDEVTRQIAGALTVRLAALRADESADVQVAGLQREVTRLRARIADLRAVPDTAELLLLEPASAVAPPVTSYAGMIARLEPDDCPRNSRRAPAGREIARSLS